MLAAISRSDAAAPAHQRTEGEGRIAFARRDGRTVLRDLYQRGAVKLRMPRAAEAEAVLINTAGGLTGGDRLALSVEIDAGARATVTTQACERIYRSLGGAAEIDVAISVGAGGRFDWLPQETILFNRGELRRRLTVDLAPDAAFLAVEAVIFGRHAMGERVHTTVLHDRWRVRRGGSLLFADDLRVDGNADALLAHPAALAGKGAMASLLYAGPEPERHVDAVRAALGDEGGASAFDGKLTARIVADDGLALRRALVPALAALRGAPLPRVWQM